MDDSFESPNAKYIHEIYSDKNELEMLEADFCQYCRFNRQLARR